MRKIIHSFDYQKRIFYCINNKKKEAFYMSNRLFKLFGLHLKKGVLVDFETGNKRVSRGIPTQTVKHFNQIISLNPYKVLYDIDNLRKDMFNVVTSNDYFLFADFEMSMPGYNIRTKFTPEIIQAGLILVNKDGDMLEKHEFYIKRQENKPLSKRTYKFLNIDEETYTKNSVDFVYLTNILSKIIITYKPKIVTWGKNDEVVLLNSIKRYNINLSLSPLDFIDLLQLHKDYYNLDNDVGLFKAYSKYYNKTPDQTHDAYEDALVTKLVFEGFIKEIKKHVDNNNSLERKIEL